MASEKELSLAFSIILLGVIFFSWAGTADFYRVCIHLESNINLVNFYCSRFWETLKVRRFFHEKKF